MILEVWNLVLYIDYIIVAERNLTAFGRSVCNSLQSLDSKLSYSTQLYRMAAFALINNVSQTRS
jgi:hypothetical protein